MYRFSWLFPVGSKCLGRNNWESTKLTITFSVSFKGRDNKNKGKAHVSCARYTLLLCCCIEFDYSLHRVSSREQIIFLHSYVDGELAREHAPAKLVIQILSKDTYTFSTEDISIERINAKSTPRRVVAQ